ncbi:DNA-binding response regulator [Fibrisoma montanum]|uniref:DNA-binding response regulator n=1 Tax=Fibrisoma montanum TaxID=2305895 RepID=A0A418M176_9BACT|nr:LytTR family DNA-binding domain-containing protein [Fibrisoma montanum]RIV19362.1 DNA-binding response regulator [Fibrisoma montanum]
MMVSCIAVDDEPLALGLVSAFIEKTPFLNLVGRYSSAVEALRGLHELSVDLIFLDIQMPDLTGIELARVLEPGPNGRAPRVIFTTAYNQFALDGYKVDALDYLLKPFNYEEFLRAANKAKAYIDLIQRAGSSRFEGPLDRPASDLSPMRLDGAPELAEPAASPVATVPHQQEDYLFLKVEYQLVRVAFDDILYIEGLKDYVKVHLRFDPHQNKTPKPLLSLTSLKALEEKLPSRRFMRVHRSFIVSLDKIEAVTRNTIQIGAVTIPVSDQYKDAFAQFLSKWT